MVHVSSSEISCAYERVVRVRREQRRFQRQAVRLSGTLFEANTLIPLATLTVTHVSLDGIAFVTQWLDIQVGQAFTVLLRLDDDRQTVLQEDIVVRTKQPTGIIGAAFDDSNRYNFHLDFYLPPMSEAF
jgi:hypothetical protein